MELKMTGREEGTDHTDLWNKVSPRSGDDSREEDGVPRKEGRT